MSAITGIFYRDGRKVGPELIKKMNDKLSHRGPDGSAVWCEGPVALGHQMLWTTPESLHEKLPFEDNESGLVITADTRIDNRDELSKELDIEDKEEVSDSYFILKAYQMWGEDCPDKLLGDFAFAIWDKNEEKLFCARDHMGVKPFYYYLSDEMFVFGTEIKALFCVPKLRVQINESQIAYYLLLIITKEREMTFYDNILRLPAAHSLTIKFGVNDLKEYWTLNLEYEIHLDSDEEYEKVFLDIFTKAVRCRLRSAYPVGSMLSGGLDSSSVTCTAQKILQNKGKDQLKTFSAVFDSVPESNERYFIEKVLSSSKFESYFINADKISPLKELDKFFWYGDQPFVVPNIFMSWNIYRESNRNNVRVLLDGLEGDITVSHGNGFLTELARTGRWKKLYFELNSKSKRLGIRSYKLFLGTCIDIILKKKVLMWLKNKREYNYRSQIIKKDFAEKMQLMNSIIKINNENIGIDSAHRQHYRDLKSGLIQYGMEFADWMSGAFSIESRHPFYDKRLVEFCLAIPTEQKFSNGWDRFIMRRAMFNIIPREIQWRKRKGNLGYNHNRSMIKYEKELLDNIILKNNFSIHKYVNITVLKGIYNQFKKGNTKKVIYIWNAVILSLWMQKQKIEQKDIKK